MNVRVQPEHQMLVMDRNGHSTVVWDPNDQATVEDARREFNRLLGEGNQAFEMDLVHDNGAITEKKGKRLTAFNPELGKIMMVPHLAGG